MIVKRGQAAAQRGRAASTKWIQWLRMTLWLRRMRAITEGKTETHILRARAEIMSSKEEKHFRGRRFPSRMRQMPMPIGRCAAMLVCEDCRDQSRPRGTIVSTTSSHTTPFSLGADTACAPRGGTCRIGG